MLGHIGKIGHKSFPLSQNNQGFIIETLFSDFSNFHWHLVIYQTEILANKSNMSQSKPMETSQSYLRKSYQVAVTFGIGQVYAGWGLVFSWHTSKLSSLSYWSSSDEWVRDVWIVVLFKYHIYMQPGALLLTVALKYFEKRWWVSKGWNIYTLWYIILYDILNISNFHLKEGWR